ncbi:MAG: ATP-binding domain-containing protein [Actinobacteria bacterium]|nr:ATP-binding domain-containing protein [Actinomycetota bacterium]MBU1609607.1 ATP-binding domain-containing protein [Actinomycetota bacterium]MBU2315442.1 ATP-binding domain-containing protein [Actinomycetota bacterium]MBU2384704.1 ATP-binding domain-containing protein [Actinomycetota bacterium]
MTTEDSKVIADERAIEKKYRSELKRKAVAATQAISQVVRNTLLDMPKEERALSGEIIGRVALEHPEEILDGKRDFYIGTSRLSGDGFEVFSWAAPVSTTYYRGSRVRRGSRQPHAWCDQVAAVRVFAHAKGELSDFQDEIEIEEDVAALFPPLEVEIPRAPGRPVVRAKRPTIFTGTPKPEATPDEDPVGATTEPAAQRPSAPAVKVPGPALRAPELLRRQLAAPKTGAMSAVLSTLQTDQYDAIVRDAVESQILQGHPGTGKTVIAAHRAAYLLSPEAPREARAKGTVLVLGPTVEYVEHIASTLGRLIDDPDRYEVKALPTLLDELAGLKESSEPTESIRYTDVDLGLADLIDHAFKLAKSNVGEGERPTAADVYYELINFLDDPPNGVLEKEWAEHLRELPKSYEEIRRQRLRRHRGLLAYIGARTTRRPNPGHVIVDEAQDITPIEWKALAWLGNRGGWTILGDLNQRRTDHTFSSWSGVTNILAIEDEEGRPPVRVLERGYRSTGQIISFANQLLSRADRSLYSLQQDGEVPTVTKVASGQNAIDAGIAAALALVEQVGEGTVAIITPQQRGVTAGLSKQGWQAVSAGSTTWTDGSRQLRILVPERARGLEFDGVVVIEPSDFPENVGRQGVLYTALTRANRHLTVVHRKSLPKGLKAPR